MCVSDTSLTEALQEMVATSQFVPCLQLEQELLRGNVDCDKPCPYIEECIGKKAPLFTVRSNIIREIICYA